MDTDFEKPLRLTAKKHDLTVIQISDPAEDDLPDVGLISLRDPETGKVALINTRNRTLRKHWHDHRQGQNAYLSDMVKKAGVDLVQLTTNGPVVQPLTQLFDMRRRRL
jgi:hypothetical protein